MRRLVYTILSLILIYIPYINSQDYCGGKYNFVWIMGGEDIDTTHNKFGGCEINFNSTPVSFNIHPKVHTVRFQNASMCSEDGELIFYSNGCLIVNALDNPMDNGDSLNPGESFNIRCPAQGYVGFQNMIALPSSYDDSIFTLLYIDLVFNYTPGHPFPIQPEHLYSSTINLAGGNGLGTVISKNDIVLQDTNMMGGPLTAVKHSNGLDWWIITPDRWTNSFNRVLLNENGAKYIGKQYIGEKTDASATAGQGKFSPDGTKFAWYHPLNSLFLYNFDRETGVLSNFKQISIPSYNGIAGGCEFSPSGQFLYINHDTSLFQLDVTSPDIQSSLKHIADFDKFADPLPTAFFYMERTPDHRIFMNLINGSQWLHVIQEPDKMGTECRFEQHSIKLPTVNNFTLPHFPNYLLGPLGEPLCDSGWVSTEFPIKDTKTEKYNVAPNPTFNYLRISSFENEYIENIEVAIFDTNGCQVLRSKHAEIDLRHLPNGIYICMIADDTGIVQIEKIGVVK